LFAAPLRDLVGLIDARIEQLGEGTSADAEVPDESDTEGGAAAADVAAEVADEPAAEATETADEAEEPAEAAEDETE
jgi:hypothetical protein